MTNTQRCAKHERTPPDFGIARDTSAHGRTVQKESLASRRRASLLALGSSAAWLLVGCVTGQVVDGTTDPTQLPSAGSASMSNTAGGSAGSAAHPNGGTGGSGGASSGHAGSAPQGGASGTTSMGGASGSGVGVGGMVGAGGSAGAAIAGAGGMPATECSNKRGIAYAFDDSTASADMGALKPGVSWFYGWATAPSAAAKPVYAANLEFVPMVWGGGFNVANVVKQIPAGAKYLLGFNEPNFGNEANLTPDQAAGMWPQIEDIAGQKSLQIVSPALNYCAGNCNQTDPFVWLDAFFAACPNCKVDYVGAHWYACTINALTDYIGKMKKYNKPIWLTEFACADGGPYTPDEVKTYALQAELWLEHEPSVFRYSWFSGRTTAISNVNLLANGGVLTDLGSAYVNQTPKRCP
jgi:hypothetical protein